MKLIGRKTEQELREQLIKSKESLFGSEEKKRLLEVLRNIYPKMNTVYILHWIPEQGEDIYKVLINDNMIAVVELNRYNTKVEPEVQLMSVPQYIQGLNKQKQIKLAVAIDLAKQSLEK
ncbi:MULTISPECIES: hypothetical protein [Shouchella]|uniref:hypothetical protein n=1 Tax=Shouchella TaxID=2893057 RepID=UPI000922D285|nr:MULTISPECIES: hypothetical protein [Shouchella]MBX0320516.1 hypothetical protein [Shouchella clausii]PAE91581.1 hypothetical protein CHH70_18000 [Shouchella clausii]SHL61892.1 hypothetical protein SAMN05192535_2851 [Shouchella rhizosphaerae]